MGCRCNFSAQVEGGVSVNIYIFCNFYIFKLNRLLARFSVLIQYTGHHIKDRLWHVGDIIEVYHLVLGVTIEVLL